MAKLTLGKMKKRKATKADLDRAEKQRKITEKSTGKKTPEAKKIIEKEKSKTSTLDKPIELNKPKEPFSYKKAGVAAAVGAGAGLAIAAAPVGAVAATGAAVIRVTPAVMKSVRVRLAFAKLAKKAVTKIPAVKTAVIKGGQYATNTKTSSLTKKLLIGAGFSLAGASIAKDLIGTYPFASFGKEETLQSISFTMTQAINAGLYEEAQGILDASNEIVNNTPTLTEKIPYANVQKEFTRYAEQQSKNNIVWQEIINKKIGEATGENETEFAKQQRENSEAAKQREIEGMKWKSQYYALIREGKFEEAEELLSSRE